MNNSTEIFNKLLKEAKELFEKYDLKEWTLKLDTAKVRFGVCNHSIKVISLSEKLVVLNAEKNYEKVHNVLIHEVAHALSRKRFGVRGKGHGHHWKYCVLELGGVPERCYNPEEFEIVKGKYKYVCSEGHVHYFHKRLKRAYACGICSEKYNIKRFDSRFILKLSE